MLLLLLELSKLLHESSLEFEAFGVMGLPFDYQRPHELISFAHDQMILFQIDERDTEGAFRRQRNSGVEV